MKHEEKKHSEIDLNDDEMILNDNKLNDVPFNRTFLTSTNLFAVTLESECLPCLKAKTGKTFDEAAEDAQLLNKTNERKYSLLVFKGVLFAIYNDSIYNSPDDDLYIELSSKSAKNILDRLKVYDEAMHQLTSNVFNKSSKSYRKRVELILKNDLFDASIRAPEGKTFLMEIAMLPDSESVFKDEIHEHKVSFAKTVIKKGTNVNAIDDRGFTALTYVLANSCNKKDCVEAGQKNLLQVLLENGAIVNLTYCDEKKYKILPGKNISVLEPYFWENSEISHLLLSLNADVTLNYRSDYSPLHFASLSCDVSLVGEVLDKIKTIENNSNIINKKNYLSQTPLNFFASRYKNFTPYQKASALSIIKKLVEFGADVTIPDSYGNTPMVSVKYSTPFKY